MIQISDTAIDKIKAMLSQEETQNLFLRLGVDAGGCSGFSYGMSVDNEQHDNDESLDFDGLKVVVKVDDKKYLNGLKIDYKESTMGGGFTIDNPNAMVTCGCGTSFRTKEEAGQPSDC